MYIYSILMPTTYFSKTSSFAFTHLVFSKNLLAFVDKRRKVVIVALKALTPATHAMVGQQPYWIVWIGLKVTPGMTVMVLPFAQIEWFCHPSFSLSINFVIVFFSFLEHTITFWHLYWLLWHSSLCRRANSTNRRCCCYSNAHWS